MKRRSGPISPALILLAGLLASLPTALWPEDIHLQDGTVVRGTIVRQSRYTLEISTTAGRRLTLNKADVTRIRYYPARRTHRTTHDRERQARQRKERAALQARKASEARKAEQLRAAENQRRAEELRAAEDQRKAEELRTAEDHRKAEEQRTAEEQRKADALRAAEDQRKAEEQRRADALRAAEDQRKAEELSAAEDRRRAEESRAAEERRRAEELRTVEQDHTRETSPGKTSTGTWVEPYLSVGGGAYGSIIGQLAAVRSRAEDAASLVSNDGVVTVDTPDEVTYNDLWSMNLGIRGGRNRWLGEADLRTFSSNASYGHLHSDSSGTSVRLFGTEPFTQKQLSVQGGYSLFQSRSGSIFALAGLRWTQARTAIQEIGISIPDVRMESVSLGTTMTIDGWGPQAGLGWQMQLPRWPIGLSVRGSLFRMNVTGALFDAVLMPATTASPQDSALVIDGESIMTWTGQQLSIRTSYRFRNGIEAFAELDSTRTRSTVTRTTGTAWFLTAGTVTPAPMDVLSAALRSSLSSSDRAEYFTGVRLGITRRFEL